MRPRHSSTWPHASRGDLRDWLEQGNQREAMPGPSASVHHNSTLEVDEQANGDAHAMVYEYLRTTPVGVDYQTGEWTYGV